MRLPGRCGAIARRVRGDCGAGAGHAPRYVRLWRGLQDVPDPAANNEWIFTYDCVELQFDSGDVEGGPVINHAVRALVAVMALPAVLGGCATIEGAPRRVIDDQRSMALVNAHPMDKAVQNFHSKDDGDRHGMSPQAYRDMVVAVYLNAIDARYNAFRSRISGERRELDSGIDIAVLTLTNAITASATRHARDLAAIASTFGGAGRALNRDLFFDQALPALLSAMDTGRLRVLARIQQNLGRNEQQYPLSTAFADLNAYEMAGTLDRAVQEVNSQVASARQDAEQDLANIVQSCNATADAIPLVGNLSDYIRELTNPNPEAPATVAGNETKLRQIAVLMELPPAVIAAPTDALVEAILDNLSSGRSGNCRAADLQNLIARIEQQTQDDIP